MSGHLTVGTAGHIDHGKTALVGALTGYDTDRLAEEKRRGISIELGFAELELGARRLSLVDVPGHERFVRTMIAGAGGVDLFLMVVAADDGVMPQTREHAIVLEALGIDGGVIALTKCDLVDRFAREESAREALELLPGRPVLEVSSTTGMGLAGLRRQLALRAEEADRRVNSSAAELDPVVLHVDRVFTIRGHGTVVTGTLWSGTIRRGDKATVLPWGRPVRIREVQVHNRKQECAGPRQRVAVNLVGVRREEIGRGDVIVGADARIRPTYRLDVQFSTGFDQLRDHQRVQVHHGTREAPARVVPLANKTAQLRLEAPLMAGDGDRVVVRRIAPPGTIGGGIILDAQAPRRGRGHTAAPTIISDPELEADERAGEDHSASVDAIASSALAGSILKLLRTDGAMPRASPALAEALGVGSNDLAPALAALVARGDLVRVRQDMYYPASELEDLKRRAIAAARPAGEISVAELRDALRLTRRYSLAILEYLDSVKITVRHGNQHKLRRHFSTTR